MDASWRLLYDGLLIKGFLPAVKGLPERLSTGLRVADLGCGTGHAINLMAREYPRSDFVGYDIAEDAIERARAEARAMGLRNARFEVVDVTSTSSRPSTPSTTSATRPPSCDARRRRSLPMGSTSRSSHEPPATSRTMSGTSFAPWLYGISVLHCMTVSLAEGGEGLGTAWGEQTARRFLAEAGFPSVEVVEAPGPQNSI